MKKSTDLLIDPFTEPDQPEPKPKLFGVDVLCAYIQHDILFYGASDVWTLYSMSKEGSVVIKNGLHTEVVTAENLARDFHIILNPLDSMSSQIVQELGFKDTKELRFAIANGTISYNQFDRLASEHYDLFGLFEDGMAVDKKRFSQNV